MSTVSEGWEGKYKILVILAHPDDPEFFCGASIARWTSSGHSVSYCLLTRGDKGTMDPTMTTSELAKIRETEQRAAASVLGVADVEFLDYEDGYLFPDIDMRKQVIRVIRKTRPDVLVTCDPTNFFIGDQYLNHPDHRAAGQVVADAYFPGAGSRLFFPELEKEGLLPHRVRELWFSLTQSPNIILDVSQFWERKVEALLEHRSQIGDAAAFVERMWNGQTDDTTEETPKYEEKFRRIIYS
jgi:LmbE family N-acetylglucosaminyl deacetylase